MKNKKGSSDAGNHQRKKWLSRCRKVPMKNKRFFTDFTFFNKPVSKQATRLHSLCTQKKVNEI